MHDKFYLRNEVLHIPLLTIQNRKISFIHVNFYKIHFQKHFAKKKRKMYRQQVAGRTFCVIEIRRLI